MKSFSIALLTTLVAAVAAGVPKPEVTVGLNIGDTAPGSLGGLEPRVKWQSAGNVGGVDVEGGMDMAVTEIDEIPTTNVWGKLKKSIPGFGDVSLRGGLDTSDRDTIDLDMRANGFGAELQMRGQADMKSKSVAVNTIQASKDVDALGGKLSFVPKYDVAKEQADVRVGYSMDGTSVQVDAQKKQLTVSHDLTDKDTITPSVNADGDVSVAYSRALDNGGRVTTTWAPNDSVKMQWNDGEWETTVKAQLDGYYKANQGLKVNMKRTVGMF